MNLLPRPRSIVVGDGRAPARPPVARIDPSLPPQGYELAVGPDDIVIAAADDAGAFYGRATLTQLERLHGAELPVVTIRDWPDIAIRGVLLDVSRDKVPTMDTLRELVDRLASWKVNQVQLYLEHTYAYRDHRDVWAEASPFTPDELHDLDEHCRARHVELVPNQNCLGHFGRWLRHDRYRPLAIAPDGWVNPFGRRRPPTTIDPTAPGSLALVRGLLAELLPNFASRRVHVGLDEPWELPAERHGDYERWIRTLRSLPELDEREMLVWGDILATDPALLAGVPDGVTVCEWGYEDWHPFAARTEVLAEAGLPFWVCPGTSSWLSILGRVANMRGDCVAAMEAALAHGGSGFLVTDWGDMGHLQYLPVSEPGFAFAAAVSWCLEANRDLDLSAALDAHAFGDTAGELGAALVALGDLHRLVVPQVPNVSSLALHLYHPQLHVGRGPTRGMTDDDLAVVGETLTRARGALDRARPSRPDGALVLDELANAVGLVDLLVRDARGRLAGDGSLESMPEPARRELGHDLAVIIERHRELWLARNRPGGLADSSAWLEHLFGCYESGVADPEWGEW